MRLSYLNMCPYTGKTMSLYWNDPLVARRVYWYRTYWVLEVVIFICAHMRYILTCSGGTAQSEECACIEIIHGTGKPRAGWEETGEHSSAVPCGTFDGVS